MIFLSFILVGLSAFLLTFLLCLVIRKASPRMGLIDITGREARKDHGGKPALVGGIAIFLGLFSTSFFWLTPSTFQTFITLFWGMAMFLALGIYDDARHVPALAKLGLQIIIASIVVFGFEMKLYNLGYLNGEDLFSLGDLAGVFTVICILVFTNAFNLVDGLDGLSGSIALIMALTMGGIANISGLIHIQDVLMILASCLCGFLILNMRSPLRKKAIVFMGDGGSLSISYALAWTAIALGNEYSATPLTPPPMTYAYILAYPIFDMLTVMLDRFHRGNSLFAPDTNHLHHVLKKLGLRVRVVALLLTALSTFYAVTGLALWICDIPQNVSLILWGIMLGAHYALYRYLVRRPT